MQLADYIDQYEDGDATAFGAKINVHWTSVYRYMRGRLPDSQVMARILEVTGGRVTPNDFFGIESSGDDGGAPPPIEGAVA